MTWIEDLALFEDQPHIDGHSYLPPAKFCQAVLDCPPMRSIAYLKAVLGNGGREIMKAATLQDRAPREG